MGVVAEEGQVAERGRGCGFAFVVGCAAACTAFEGVATLEVGDLGEAHDTLELLTDRN